MNKTRFLLIFALIAAFTFGVSGQSADHPNGNTPELADLDSSKSEMRSIIERFINDRGSLSRSYPVEFSPARQVRFKQFYTDWLALIGRMNFDTMSIDGKIDYMLLKYHLDHELKQLEIQIKSFHEIS